MMADLQQGLVHMVQIPLQPTLCAEKYKVQLSVLWWPFATGSGDFPIFPSRCVLLRDFWRLRDCEFRGLLRGCEAAAALTRQIQSSVGVTSAEYHSGRGRRR